MSDLPRDPAEGGVDDEILDQTEDLETEVEDAEPGEEPEEAVGEETEEAEPERRRGRPRGQAYGEQIRELRSQNETLQRRLDEMARGAAPRPDPQAAQAAEAKFWADLELMSPQEMVRAVYARAQNEMRQALGATQLSTQEAIDKQTYESKALTSGVHQRYRQRVEDMVAMERNRGNVLSREVALKYLVGEDALQRSGRVLPQQRRQAAARVGAQTVRPGAGGASDVARGGGRRDQASEDERLLRGLTAGEI